MPLAILLHLLLSFMNPVNELRKCISLFMFPRGKEGIKCISDKNVNFSVCPGSPICPESLNSLPRKDGTAFVFYSWLKICSAAPCLACFFLIFPSALFFFPSFTAVAPVFCSASSADSPVGSKRGYRSLHVKE